MSKNKNKSTKSPPPRNSIVVPMNLRNKTQIFADRREPKGGDKNEQRDLLDIYDECDIDCSVSFEQAERELQEIENKIAIKLGLKENVRNTLIELDKLNYLVENELVAKWRELFSIYNDFFEWNERSV